MKPGVYRVFCRKGKAKQRCTLLRSARAIRLLYSVRPVLVPLKPIGQLYGEVGAFADLPCGVIVLMGQTLSFECLEELVQILRQELPAKDRIDPCPHKLKPGRTSRIGSPNTAGNHTHKCLSQGYCWRET